MVSIVESNQLREQSVTFSEKNHEFWRPDYGRFNKSFYKWSWTFLLVRETRLDSWYFSSAGVIEWNSHQLSLTHLELAFWCAILLPQTPKPWPWRIMKEGVKSGLLWILEPARGGHEIWRLSYPRVWDSFEIVKGWLVYLVSTYWL